MQMETKLIKFSTSTQINKNLRANDENYCLILNND
jgi:hypothetical protein